MNSLVHTGVKSAGRENGEQDHRLNSCSLPGKLIGPCVVDAVNSGAGSPMRGIAATTSDALSALVIIDLHGFGDESFLPQLYTRRGIDQPPVPAAVTHRFHCRSSASVNARDTVELTPSVSVPLTGPGVYHLPVKQPVQWASRG